jgi:hypothetical protein
MEHLRAEEIFQSLAEESKRQGRFGHISPARSHGHAVGRELHSAVKDRRFAQPRLPEDEQRSTLSRRGLIEDLLQAAQHALSLCDHAHQTRPPFSTALSFQSHRKLERAPTGWLDSASIRPSAVPRAPFRSFWSGGRA